MTQSEFEILLHDRTIKIIEVLGSKAKEYAQEGDRLYNFKVAGKISGTSWRRALWGMALKHLVSVVDLVNGNLPNTKHNVDEKIGDMINYLILLEAVMQEERGPVLPTLGDALPIHLKPGGVI